MSVISSILSVVGSAAGGGIGGIVMHAASDTMKFIDDRNQRDHEYRMTQLQIQVDAARSKQQIDVVQAQGAAATDAGELQALVESIKGQSQKTGVRWVDGVSATVRPFVTYFVLLLYATYKATVIYSAWGSAATVLQFGAMIWGPDDIAMLSAILAFWFIDRKQRRQAGK